MQRAKATAKLGFSLTKVHGPAQVNISTDADLGTVYSVAVPIKRVKPVARVPMTDDVDVEGITLRWDADDKNSDPSDQFPFGC